ncbi:MAG: DNA-directed RNA polymerase subunit P [Candidatus Verstraetearchaeota archaeon]|nr:DNA-directed RNA polymerase subunit P [Candidatus Verstraetearchaeota archaeon]
MANYLCEKCGKVIKSEDLIGLPGIRCPSCSHRILYKSRSPIIREIRAR